MAHIYGSLYILTHMKTTIEISDGLLTSAKRLAAREGTTLRALLEEGLRRVVEGRKGAASFRLRKASFKGRGLRPDVREGDWERLRDIAYEGRGA